MASHQRFALPTIASKEELHTANSLTQTTQWSTLTIGAFLGGVSVKLGYEWAFFFNALSFVFSALCISRLRAPGRGFCAKDELTEARVVQPWHEYIEGLRYVRSKPLILGIMLIAVGWATGGGAAQILFSLFGELVFKRGAAGIGYLWGSAGLGLLAGGAFAHWWGKRINFTGYKRTVAVCFVVHGGAYVLFSQMKNFWAAMLLMGLSRAAVAISSVMNMSQLFKHVSNEYRGRVFSTLETMTWAMMMGAGIASTKYDPRLIGAVAGVLSSTTAIFWAWANWTGRLPEP